MTVQFAKMPFKLVENPNAAPTAAYGQRQLEILSPRGLAQARALGHSYGKSVTCVTSVTDALRRGIFTLHNGGRRCSRVA